MGEFDKSRKYKVSEILLDNTIEKDLKVLRYQKKKLTDGQFSITAKVSDRFNYVRPVSVIFDDDGETFFMCSCECQKVKNVGICKHITAFISYYDSDIRHQIISIEAKENDKKEQLDNGQDDSYISEDAELFDFLVSSLNKEKKASELSNEGNCHEYGSDKYTGLDYSFDFDMKPEKDEPMISLAKYENDFNTADIFLDSSNEIDNDTASEDTETEPETNAEPHVMQVLFGNNIKSGEPIYWCPNDTEQVFHTNIGIIGTMGTGKTQFTKSLVTQLFHEQQNGKNFDSSPLGILIFDYKGDYNSTKADFVYAVNANVLKPYRIPYNPLALNRTKMFMPLLPVHTADTFKETITKIFNLGHKQQQLLFDCIINAYYEQGIDPENPRTWHNTEPTFEQVYKIFEKESVGRTPDSLTSVMKKLHQFHIFEEIPEKTRTLNSLLNGVVVMDLSGYDKEIQSLVVAITLDQFYTQMHAYGSSKYNGRYRQLRHFILVDEADHILREDFPSMRKIIKEGREFGVGMILSTQSLKHFAGGEDDYSKYILTWVIHNVNDLSQRDIEYVMRLNPKSEEVMVTYTAVKNLVKHESVVKISNDDPLIIQDRAFWQLCQENL